MQSNSCVQNIHINTSGKAKNTLVSVLLPFVHTKDKNLINHIQNKKCRFSYKEVINEIPQVIL